MTTTYSLARDYRFKNANPTGKYHRGYTPIILEFLPRLLGILEYALSAAARIGLHRQSVDSFDFLIVSTHD